MLVTASPPPCPAHPPNLLPGLSGRLFAAPMYTGFAQLICTCWHHLFFSCVLIRHVWVLHPSQLCSRAGMRHPPSDWGSSGWGTVSPLRLGLLRLWPRLPLPSSSLYTPFSSPGGAMLGLRPWENACKLDPPGQDFELQRKPPDPSQAISGQAGCPSGLRAKGSGSGPGFGS